MNEWLAVLAGVGLAAACGMRVFLPLFVVSLAVNNGFDGIGGFGLREVLGEDFAWIGSTPVTVMLGVASGLEIASYYVPWIDNALDTVATPAAVLAGWFVSGIFMPEGMGDGAMKWAAAAVVGGGMAGLVQGGTVAARGTSSATTGGLGNFVVATGELIGSLLTSVLAVIVPVVAGIVAIVIAGFMLGLFLKLRRRLRGGDPPAVA